MSISLEPTAQESTSGSKRPIEAVLVSLGAVAIIAAIVGGGLDAAGIHVPILSSIASQILLAVAGIAFLLIGLASRWMLIPALLGASKLESDYNDLILKTNDLWFAPGGIKDLLADYRRNMSINSWTRVQDRAALNEARLASVVSAKEKVRDLAGNPDVAHELEQLVSRKRYYLYRRLQDIPNRPEELEIVDELISSASDLDAMITSQIQRTQRALVDLRNAAQNNRRALEARIFH
jgi:hypothetical protein